MSSNKKEKINYNDFQELLKKNNLLEACQYLESVWDIIIAFIPISYKQAEHTSEIISEGETKFINKMDSDMEKQLLDGNTFASYRPKFSDFPKNMCNFAGREISAELIFKKNLYEFFHWTKICIDLIAQLINSTLLGDDKMPIEKVKLNLVKDKIKNKPICINLFYLVDAAIESKEYKYVQAFDNCAKHIKLIPNNIATVQMSFGETAFPKFTINAFSYRNIDYIKVDALQKIDEIEEYIRKLTYSLLIEIQKIIKEENNHEK